MSVSEFIAWEERQELRWEFDGVRAVAMNGGTIAHETIADTLRALLRERLRGSGCRVFGPGLKIATAGGIRYPDALITCSRVEGTATIAPDPVVLFEVQSASTGGIDRIVKLREYQMIPSVQHYVMLEQSRIGALVLSRTKAETWEATALTQGDTMAFPKLGIEVALDDVYQDVDLPDADAPE